MNSLMRIFNYCHFYYFKIDYLNFIFKNIYTIMTKKFE